MRFVRLFILTNCKSNKKTKLLHNIKETLHMKFQLYSRMINCTIYHKSIIINWFEIENVQIFSYPELASIKHVHSNYLHGRQICFRLFLYFKDEHWRTAPPLPYCTSALTGHDPDAVITVVVGHLTVTHSLRPCKQGTAVSKLHGWPKKKKKGNPTKGEK